MRDGVHIYVTLFDLKFIKWNFNPTLIWWTMQNRQQQTPFSLAMLPPMTKTMVISHSAGETRPRAGLERLYGSHIIWRVQTG